MITVELMMSWFVPAVIVVKRVSAQWKQRVGGIRCVARPGPVRPGGVSNRPSVRQILITFWRQQRAAHITSNVARGSRDCANINPSCMMTGAAGCLPVVAASCQTQTWQLYGSSVTRLTSKLQTSTLDCRRRSFSSARSFDSLYCSVSPSIVLGGGQNFPMFPWE